MVFLTLFVAAFALASARWAQGASAPSRPTRLHVIEEVLDGDTIQIERNGVSVRVRLCSVDTEEKISGHPSQSPSKPQTVFGEETALWARALLAERAPAGIGLRFPDGAERLDAFGRLLCHVLLPDGVDFNLLLVRQGRSPYFNKYGNSRVCHDAFVAAQRAARAERKGIWNPQTNRPRAPEARGVRRDYAALLVWWDLRAQAIDGFRGRRARNPSRFLAADDPDALQRAMELCAKNAEVRVTILGEVAHVFEERGGEQTVLLRSRGGGHSLRVRVPARLRAELAPLDLERIADEFRQNYVYATGVLEPEKRGFQLRLDHAGALRLAGPE